MSYIYDVNFIYIGILSTDFKFLFFTSSSEIVFSFP